MRYSLITSSPLFRAEAGAITEGKKSHAYIIEGPAGAGKHSLALALTAAYFCTSQGGKPCFLCEQCRKVLHEHHADVHSVIPEKKLLKVDQIRQMLSTVYETPYEGGAKVYLLENFHLANEQAQNALLKTLEEPPRSVIFFLLVESAALLLSTVRSRCRLLRLPGFPEQEIRRQLEELFPGDPKCEKAAVEAEGNMGRAIRLMQEQESWLLLDQARAILDGQMPAPAVASLLEKDKDNLDGLLEELEEELHRRLRTEQNKAAVLEKLKAVEDAQLDRKKNVNGGLVADELAYALKKGGKQWQR